MSRPRSFKATLVVAVLGLVVFVQPTLAVEHGVSIRDNAFVPATLSIKVGDTVKWTNDEKRTSHSVLFPGNPSLESERMMPGDVWSRTFDAVGNVPYTCGPHPHMQGAIEVTP